MKHTLTTVLLLLLACTASAEPFPVRIQIDAAHPGVPLKPIWRFFGADEPNYAYMPHGNELLGELGALKKDEAFSAPTICSSPARANTDSTGAPPTAFVKSLPPLARHGVTLLELE